LAYTGTNLSKLKAGTQFDELNGHKICQKYITQATKNAAKQQNTPKKKKDIPMFHPHFDTPKLRYNLHSIPVGANLILTEKLHGTSGRTGYVQIITTLKQIPWWRRPLVKLGAFCLGVEPQFSSWKTVTGTRRVILGDPNTDDLFYKGQNFRGDIHKRLDGLLYKGETLYYEIVGYAGPNSPFFSHSLEKDEITSSIKKRYKQYATDKMIYHYDQENGTNEIYVYRITRTNEDGQSIDLSWNQIKQRCRTLGLKTVPELAQITYDGSPQTLTDYCNQITNHSSTLSSKHIMEGVCIRVDHEDSFATYKYKSFDFCHLEGIAKNSEHYVDIEEIA